MTDTEKVADEIVAGDHDGKLGVLLDALRRRALEGPSFAWRIRFDGWEITQETITLGVMSDAERLAGVSFFQMNPRTSASHLAAVLTAQVRKQNATTLDKAAELVDTLVTQVDLPGIVDEYEVPAKTPAPAAEG